MTLVITIIHIIVCFILICVILLQAGRGQGLTGASFGSGNVQSLLGTRAADFLTKATLVAAVLFILTCLSLDFIETRRSRSLLQADRPGAPITMNQIKEALEKVKGEAKIQGGEDALATAPEADDGIDQQVGEIQPAAPQAISEETGAAGLDS